jgi:hypothetical protein
MNFKRHRVIPDLGGNLNRLVQMSDGVRTD